MLISDWIFILDTQIEKNAKVVMNRIFAKFNQQPICIQYSVYQKDGFNGIKVNAKFQHEISDWNLLDLTIIELGLKLGFGWILNGDIFHSPNAVLSKNLSHISEVGLYWASWEINNIG